METQVSFLAPLGESFNSIPLIGFPPFLVSRKYMVVLRFSVNGTNSHLFTNLVKINRLPDLIVSYLSTYI